MNYQNIYQILIALMVSEGKKPQKFNFNLNKQTQWQISKQWANI